MSDVASYEIGDNYSQSFLTWRSETNIENIPSRKITVNNEPRIANFAILSITTALALGFTATTPSPVFQPNTSLVAEIFCPHRRIRPRPDVAILEEELDEYRRLGDGWDGVGTLPPLPQAIDAAFQFLHALPAGHNLPESTVSADRSVGWFWQNRDGYASVNFPGDGRFIYYGTAKGKTARGASVFDGQVIPQDLLDVISQI